MSAVPAPDPVPPADALGRVHFVGIGGAGMSGIARILLARGATVSGSDARDSRALAALRALGATTFVGHAAEHVAGADTVVVSSAIRPENPELVEARARGLLVLPRAAALAAVMAGRRAIAVAGTHGKTTTTSMLTVALQHCGADPSFAIGGSLNESGANAHNGSGDLFVAEADESDGSFLIYTPAAAIVTNVEPDHLDHYVTGEAVDEAFVQFTRRVVPGGLLVTCADDPGAVRLAQRARAEGVEVRTYGESEAADVRLESLVVAGAGSSARAVADGSRVGELTLRVPGRHNALNAAAALTMATGLGFAAEQVLEGLGRFTGTRRRFEAKGTAGGVRVYDDYAHHPTEVEATLRAARSVAHGGRVVVAFQPHRYSRTAAFSDEFGRSLAFADEVVVMDVYAAGEDPLPGATGEAVAAAVPLAPGSVHYEPSWSAVAGRLAAAARPGDIVLTLGAGDVTMIGPEVLALLAERA
ncbi:UDP-N-acetylmuramate--alanine ligase [Motilibacter peucedani]|uniref:UDP-N-acetylmuramate--L-alanine ligase n=1 Tax=Motilibacter peucedani TaxID=598650 RepID=A0A420XPI3_9ACTN|nr:UDP-N-acetylmuramate--L-alanine ligase [Motilibacter peucedani]RKS74121.1 UDP-N-acetylmuramate--alanine ligase [Motilibacter peucedani]